MTKPKQQTILREASDKTKGFRLQKLRAIRLMLDTIETKSSAVFYGAIEVYEDVLVSVADSCGTTVNYEEDKNYGSEAKFTIYSAEVLNTLVSFFDIYIEKWKSSDNMVFGFYTTANVTKEKKTLLKVGTTVSLPSEPVLKILSNYPAKIPDNVAELVKVIVLEEYSKQYKDKKYDGYLENLKKYSMEEFRRFLTSIRWYFGQEDEVSLKETVLSKIRDSRLFNTNLTGKEEIILSFLMEKLDERQNIKNFADRFIHTDTIRLVLKEVESESPHDLIDPTWNHIGVVKSSIKDQRNLFEKIISVSPYYSETKIKFLQRLACRSKFEQENCDKTFLSLKYRIYEACSGHLVMKDYSSPMAEVEVDLAIKELRQASIEQVDELKKDYKYTISNPQAIEGLILDLFDTCFIAFDEIEIDNDNTKK